MGTVIRTEGLSKSFGSVHALAGVDLEVTQGEVPAGHAIRMVAFGDTHTGARQGPWHTVPMAHVVQYLQQYLHEYWPVLRHAQLPDAPFAVLALIEKWGVGKMPSDTTG